MFQDTTRETRTTSQARVFYQKTLDKEAKDRLISNIVGHLSGRLRISIQERAIKNFSQVDAILGTRIEEGLKLIKPTKASL
ncbi:hypothetical protein NQ318_019331 [Aromia moschata]|uniref:Catalase immune-responsive domain-containing protein n=1 Tax=Aromia moschata TaxID=1265417 RepID=A0AAV8YBT0_9CUCU|nr:hypothetical protein NQ318_019331 [Aromia moschata]